MESDILDSLDNLGDSVSSLKVTDNNQRRNLLNEDKYACLRYSGPLKTDEEILNAIELGPKSLEFTQLVEWLSKELQAANDMESCVNALTDVEDSSSFLLEVSSFLRELNCPYKSLMNGPISQRLLDVQSRKTMIDYLCTELSAARMVFSRKDENEQMEIALEASLPALHLQKALKALNIEINPTRNEDPEAYLIEMEEKIKQILDSKSTVVSPPILTEELSENQWSSLKALYEDFLAEYTVRRKLLLTRLEVTVESFRWGEGGKDRSKKVTVAYLSKRKHITTAPSVKLSDVMAARESLLDLEKTSSENLVKNTKSVVNKVLIPSVPDRGGRPKEQRPPIEMPNWKKRSQDGGRGGGHQGGGGQWRGKNKKFHGNKNRGSGDNRGVAYALKIPKNKEEQKDALDIAAAAGSLLYGAGMSDFI